MIKDRRIRYTILILTLAIGAVAVDMLLLRLRAVATVPVNGPVLVVDGLTIPVSIADTAAERQQGLSDTASLPANAGKLFVFDQPQIPGFWMKDMNYPLDFIWISKGLKIVAVTPNVAVDTYPQIFYPPQQVQYVLEVNAGFAAKNNLTAGEQLSL